jgi:branched-chain amino acid transport system permease protein
MELFINQVIVGLMLGIMYSLIASGHSIFYGVLNVVQFAHADVCFLGAFIAMAIMTSLSSIGVLPVWVIIFFTVFFAILLTGLTGLLIEKVCVRPFRKNPGYIILLSTVAVGFIIREGIKNFFPYGASPRYFPLEFPEWIFRIGGVDIRFGNIMILLIAVLIYFLLSVFINKTKLGLQIRATSQNIEAAQVSGIDLDKIFTVTFFLASGIGAIAGMLNGAYYSVIKFDMGLMGGTIGFSAAVMGGLGNVYGAIIGGIIIGMVESFTMAYVPGGSPYKEIFAFIVVVIFLLFKPSGLLGKKIIEKV